jgi:chemotaxis protein MotB
MTIKINQKSNKYGSGGRAPIWMTVFADMMTNLMLFFLVVYAITRLDIDAQTRTKDALRDGLTRRGAAHEYQTEADRRKVVETEVQQEAAKINAVVTIDETRIKLSLPGESLFDSASADMKDSVRQSIAAIIEVIKKMPNKVMIEGHTDDVPIATAKYRSNWELSMARASSVAQYFIQQGVPAERVCLAAYGEYKPMSPNTDDVSRANNRRIEITIIKKRT